MVQNKKQINTNDLLFFCVNLNSKIYGKCNNKENLL